jgi:hypothetical protein
MRAKKNLTTLCGLSGEEAELDFSGQYLGAGDAVLIANDISDMGALLVLSLESNNLRADSGKALAEALKGNQVITELNIGDTNLANGGTDMSGVVALADAIPDMGALTTFDISKNDLSAEGAKNIAAILPKCT